MQVALVYRVVPQLVFAVAMIVLCAVSVPRKHKGLAGMSILIADEMAYRIIVIVWFTSGELDGRKIIPYLISIIIRLAWFEREALNPIKNFLLFYGYMVFGELGAMIVIVTVFALFTGRADINLTSLPTSPQEFALTLALVILNILLAMLMNRAKIAHKWPMGVLEVMFYFGILAEVFGVISWKMQYVKSGLKVWAPQILLLSVMAVSVWIASRRMKVEMENRNIKEEKKRQLEQFNRLSERQDEIKRFRHDLANNLNIMQNIGENEAIMAGYQEQLLQYSTRILEETREASNNEEAREIAGGKERSRRRVWIVLLFVFLGAVMLATWEISHNEKRQILFSAVRIILVLIFIYIVWSGKILTKEKEQISGEVEKRKKVNADWEEEQRQLVREQTKAIENVSGELLKTLDGQLLESTGNRIADAMMQVKYHQFREAHIKEKVQLFVPERSEIKETDMVSLLCNLIDNGIDANKRVDEEKRVLEIASSIKANFWVVTVVNAKSTGERPLRRNFLSLKPDKANHGYGIKIVKSIVHKYDGSIQMEDAGSMFKISVMLKLR